MTGFRVVLPVALLVVAMPVWGSLTTFQTYNGNVSFSSDGFGSLNTSGTIHASVPSGATVLAAYLYTSINSGASTASGTLNGTSVAYGPFVAQAPSCCGLGMRRADVTSIVKPIIDVGPGGVYNFTVSETNTSAQDGEALVVVYNLPSLPTSTVAILDGFSASSGDSFMANFTTPLNPAAPGFFMEMVLGIGFSCGDPACGTTQNSTVRVNGTTITTNAGNYDDADLPPPGNAANGRLITVGGHCAGCGTHDDPFSPMMPTYAEDHERYDLAPFIVSGSTSVVVNTVNPSGDDNIFLSIFASSGTAQVTPNVPEPATIGLIGLGLIAVALRRAGTNAKSGRRTE